MGDGKRLLSGDTLEALFKDEVESPAAVDDLRSHIAALEAEIARLTANTHTHMREMGECEDREKDQRRRAERAEAEVARLKPSGQVAEDEEKALAGLGWGKIPDGAYVTGDESRAAIRRLAAKAQGYAAAVADNAALLAQLLRTCRCGGTGWYYPPCPHCGDSTNDHECPDKKACDHSYLPIIATQPHPGAALLEEHRRALIRARNEGLELAAKTHDKEAEEARKVALSADNEIARDAYEGAAIRAEQRAARIRAMREPEL